MDKKDNVLDEARNSILESIAEENQKENNDSTQNVKEQTGEKTKEKEKEKIEIQSTNKVIDSNIEVQEKSDGVIASHLKSIAETNKANFKQMLKPGSLMTSAGLVSGSPIVAVLGGKLDEVIEKGKENALNNRTEVKKSSDFLKEQNVKSKDITNILEKTKTLSANSENEITKILLDNGVKNKSTIEEFIKIKKEYDEKLVENNYDVYKKLEENGKTEKESIEMMRQQNLMSFQKEKQDKDAADRENKQITLLDKISGNFKNLSESLKDWINDKKNSIKELALTGLALIAAPIMILVGFFEGLKDSFKFLDNLTKGGLSKIISPFVNFLKSIKTFFMKFEKVGKVVSSVGNFFSKIAKTFSRFIKFASTTADASTGILKFMPKMLQLFRTVGKFLGPLGLIITVVTGVFDTFKGFMKGFKADGIIGGIKEGLKSLIDSVILAPVKLITSIIDWVGKLFGVDLNLTGKLSGLVSGVIDSIFDPIIRIFNNIKNSILDVFTLSDNKSLFGNIIDTIVDILSLPMKIFTDIFEGLFNIDIVKIIKDKIPFAGKIMDFLGIGSETQDREIEKEKKSIAKDEKSLKNDKRFLDAGKNADVYKVNGVELTGAARKEHMDKKQQNYDKKKKALEKRKTKLQEKINATTTSKTDIEKLEEAGYYTDDFGYNTLNVEKVKADIDKLSISDLKLLQNDANLDSEGEQAIAEIIQQKQKTKSPQNIKINQSSVPHGEQYKEGKNLQDLSMSQKNSPADKIRNIKTKAIENNVAKTSQPVSNTNNSQMNVSNTNYVGPTDMSTFSDDRNFARKAY